MTKTRSTIGELGFGLAVSIASLACGSSADGEGTGESAESTADSITSGDASYLRYSPGGPAFDFLRGQSKVKVTGRSADSYWFCVRRASDGQYGWVDKGTVPKSAEDGAPSGSGGCEYAHFGVTEVIYWRCAVKAGR